MEKTDGAEAGQEEVPVKVRYVKITWLRRREATVGRRGAWRWGRRAGGGRELSGPPRRAP